MGLDETGRPRRGHGFYVEGFPGKGLGAGIRRLLVVPIIFNQTTIVVARPDDGNDLNQIGFFFVK
jgi:hypothetical protein